MRHGLLSALIAGFLVSGCASFPERPPLIGFEPTPNSVAFHSAVTEAVIRHRTGKGLYEALGERAWTMSPSRTYPCSPEALDAFVRGEFSCAPIALVHGTDCRELDLCLIFSMDPALARDTALVDSVKAALERPCEALTPPADNPYHSHFAVSGMQRPSSSLWRYFRCSHRRHVRGYDIRTVAEPGRTVITLRYRLESAEPLKGGVSPFDRGTLPPPPPPPPPPVSAG